MIYAASEEEWEHKRPEPSKHQLVFDFDEFTQPYFDEKIPPCSNHETFPFQNRTRTLVMDYHKRLMERRKNYGQERLHQCKFCLKNFVRAQSLRIHINSHTGLASLTTGEKPYSCAAPDCSWKFAARSNLYRHLRTCSKVNKPVK